MKGIRKIFDRTLEAAAIISFAGLIFMTLFQVLSRYIFSVPIAFSEEVGRFLFIWISFLGAAIVMERNEHIRLDVFAGKISPENYRKIQVLVFCLTGAFSLLLLAKGTEMLDVAFRQTAPVSRLSMGWVYLVIPISAFFMAVYSAVHLFRVIRKLKGKAR
jgi:TRAP-type C4-dicarboxylate transport system permease small subunit